MTENQIRNALGLPQVKGEGVKIVYDDGTKPSDYDEPLSRWELFQRELSKLHNIKGTSLANQYLLFAGESYYAYGGFYDFKGAFNTLDDTLKQGVIPPRCEWFHILDTEKGRLVIELKGSYSGSPGIKDSNPDFDAPIPLMAWLKKDGE